MDPTHVTVVCLPHEDRAFSAFVQLVVNELPAGSSSRDLQERVRRVYPRAMIRPVGSLASLSGKGVLRYAYRDPHVADDVREDWWTREGVAEATFDEGGVYRSANASAPDLFGLASPAEIEGRSWSEFATSESVEAADALWAELAAAGALFSPDGISSTYHLARPDGTVLPIEYHTVRDPASGMFRTWMRPIQVAHT